MKVTQARVRELLEYDAETGWFRWRVTKANVTAGSRAGCLAPSGYILIGIDGRLYRAHHLVWAYHHGAYPKMLDHADGDRANNRLENLREATHAQNNANKRKDARNTSGLKGVHWDKEKGKWAAFIKKNRKSKFLGRFDTKEAAHAAYCAAAITLNGEFARAA